MTVKKLAYKLHLWLGLVSGLIVFIVCITGAIWALSINGWIGNSDSTKYSIEPVQQQQMQTPSTLIEKAQMSLNDRQPNSITYYKKEPAKISAYGDGYYFVLLVDPYTGNVIDKIDYNKEDNLFNFWSFINRGHRSLWLPWNIGRPIVNYGTLIFALTLISGIIIWMPKSRKGFRNKIWFKWKSTTKLKKKLFDFHSILGIYSAIVLVVIALTGIVWGIGWWSKGLYKITSGGKELPAWQVAKSNTLNANSSTAISSVDKLFKNTIKELDKSYSVQYSIPRENKIDEAINLTINHDKNVYYNTDRYSFDRYTLKEIKLTGPFNGKYSEADFGDKLRRMNYDIHIGAVLGQPGRIIVFLAALFGASLPVTGYYIYFKKRKKRRKQ